MLALEQIRQQYRRMRLQTRFALHIILLVSVVFAFLIPVVLVIQEQSILRTAREKGLGLVTIFASSSVQALVADDFLGLRQVVNSLRRDENIRYAMILDLDGRVLIHTRVNEIGRVYADPLTRRSLGATEPFVQETRSTSGELLYDFAAPVLVLNQRRAVARIGLSLMDELRLIRTTRNLILGLGVLTLLAGLAWHYRQARRLRLYREVTRLVVGEIPAVFLFHQINFAAVHPRVSGLTLNIYGLPQDKLGTVEIR